MIVVRLESKIAVKARLKPSADRAGDVFPQGPLLLDPLEDQDVGVDRHADGQDQAGDAGQRQVGLEVGQDAEQDDDVEDQGDDGVDSGQAVINDHEGHDQEDGHQAGHQALADGVRPEGRADDPLFEILDPGRKRAGLEDDDEVVGRFDRELALDDARIADPGVDVGRRLDLVVQDDGQGPADVGPGDLFEAAAAVGGEGEGDGRIVPFVGAPADGPEVLAADGRDFFHEIEAGMAAAWVAADDLGVLGDDPAEGGEQRRLVLGRSGLDQLPVAGRR